MNIAHPFFWARRPGARLAANAKGLGHTDADLKIEKYDATYQKQFDKSHPKHLANPIKCYSRRVHGKVVVKDKTH